jgi:hypothetical protein
VLICFSIEGQAALRKENASMARSLVLLVGLLFATTMLTGCAVEPGYGGYYHHGWGGWHHDYDR